jgi:hypothetical protein
MDLGQWPRRGWAQAQRRGYAGFVIHIALQKARPSQNVCGY